MSKLKIVRCKECGEQMKHGGVIGWHCVGDKPHSHPKSQAILVSQLNAIPDPAIADALDAINDLCQFAYESGYHELGYDPVQVLSSSYDARIASLEAEVAKYKKDAETALRELLALKQQNEWVPVSERLPDFNQRVNCWLVGTYEHGPGMYSPRAGMAEMVRHRGETMLGEWGAMFYEQAWKKIDATHADVTHWMPLPPIPLTKESGE